jgi:hypothetical protein
MADPITTSTAGAATISGGAAGAALGVIALLSLSNAYWQRQTSREAAKLKELQAQNIEWENRINLAEHAKSSRRFEASQRVAYAKAGVTMSGTALLVAEDTSRQLEFEALKMNYRSKIDQISARTDGAAQRVQANLNFTGQALQAGAQGVQAYIVGTR